MKDLKLIVLAIFLSMSMMACQLEELLQQEETLGADDIVAVDEEKFTLAAEDLGLTEVESNASMTTSMQKLGAAIEQLAGQLMELDGMVNDGSSDDMSSDMNSDTTSETITKMLKGDMSVVHKGLGKLSGSKVMGKLAGREEDGGIAGFISDVSSMLDAAKDGNVVTYTLKADALNNICGDEDYMTGEVTVDDTCVSVIGNASIVQYMASASAGMLELHYTVNGADHVPLVMGYSETEWYLETHLADVKGTVLAINDLVGGDMIHFPATFEGSMRATIKQVDAATVAVALGVTGDINVDGQIGPEVDEVIKVSVAQSKVLELTSTKGKLTLTTDINPVSAMFNENDYDWDFENNVEIVTSKTVTISADGVKGTVVLDFTNKTITGTEVGLKGDGATVSEEVEGVTKSMTISTSTSDFTVMAPGATDAYDVKATADTAIDVSIDGTMFDDAGTAGSISVSAEAGTTIEMYPSEYDEFGMETQAGYLKVVAGSITVTGTGAAGTEGGLDIAVTANAGQCIVDDATTGEPTADVCP